MIQVSPQAAKQIARLKEEEGRGPDACLRVSVQKGGCSGMSYKMDFESAPLENDKVFEQNGVKIITDPKSLIYLIGMTLDYSGGLNGAGFTFSNPNAKKTCGCGTSFSV